MTDILHTNWHGFPALALESERMRAVLVPDLGGKIVSLFDKAHQHEWLVPPMRPVKQTAFGADFVSQDMSGWDEMMPTISACTVDGTSYPDHGEVWSIPWTVETDRGEARLSVEGKGWPYRFTRAAALVTPDCLELRYALKNNAERPFPYLWAAHPQFSAGASTHIILPDEVERVINVIEDDPAWGAAGETHEWPAARDRGGQTLRLDRVRPVNLRACRKFYVPPEQHASWAGLAEEALGCQMRLSWSPAETPYLGLWVDEGTYNARPVAAPEPSSGYYDSLERAIGNGSVSMAAPGEERRWTMRVQFS